ncbi:MAG: CAP domain-containing protein [Myxococcales bacterium]|nr:CAP domain-containing protein [Myxococcales bacterium]
MRKPHFLIGSLAVLGFSALVGCGSSDVDDRAEVDDGGIVGDAAMEEDSSTTVPDGAIGPDSGGGTADTGTAKSDTGSSPDTGTSPTDTGTPVGDAAAKDTGVAPPTDTGTPPTDSGTGGVCSVTAAGATGKEPGGAIPVCCAPTAVEKTAVMEVFKLINAHRAANGKPALTYDTKLEAAIQAHCQHMATHTFFDHVAPEAAVASFTTRASKCGTGASGENIAWGYPTPAAVMDGWKKSPGHNANMLGAHTRIGIGKSGTYWGQIFGK